MVSVSLVQVTEVAGPPVEIQVRVDWGMVSLRLESMVYVIPPDIVMSPEKLYNIIQGDCMAVCIILLLLLSEV